MPRMEEGQVINLIMKHFPISIQAYVQNFTEKKFISIWEKLGKIENRGRTEMKPEMDTEKKKKNDYRSENRKPEFEKTEER